MKDPVVSIIVPVYNVEKYIYDCVNSLIAQKFDDIEIILVDDGSTDTSGDICDKYAQKDSRIKVIHQTNEHQGKARNAGIRIARGKWITFVDSDDWVSPEFVKKMYEKAISSEADIVMCDYCRAKSKGTRIKCKSHIDKIFFNTDGIDLRTSTIQPTRKSGFCMVVCWNKLFRADLAKRYLYFPENIAFEDSAPVLRCLVMAEKITVVNEKLYFYRINNVSSTTRAKDKRRFDIIKIQRIILNDFETYDFGKFKPFCITFMIKDIIKHFRAIDDTLKAEFYRQMQEILCEMDAKGYLKFAEFKYRFKAWLILHTNYHLTLIIAKL